MNTFLLDVKFGDKTGYLVWRAEWKFEHARTARDIRRCKRALKHHHLSEDQHRQVARNLSALRRHASALHVALGEAKARRDRIIEMHKSLAAQFESFPLTLTNCRMIDFHFNKGSLEYPFLPMWTLKTQGKSFYINHIDAQLAWSTRELPEGSTRGMIRLRRGDIHINKDGLATITPAAVELKEVA